MVEKYMQIGEAKAKFSEVLTEARNGSTVIIVKGRERKPIVEIKAYKKRQPQTLELGGLAHLGKPVFSDDWEMTEEDFLGDEDFS